ncbi:MAG: ribose-phosphate diphosphokinase [Thermoproteota archaeon]
MKVIAGPTSTVLGRKVAELLNSGVVDVEQRTFPDGGSYVRLAAPVAGDEAIVVQTLSRPQDTSIMQLLQIISAAKRFGATKVVAVVPYFAYARQDKAFLEGEAVTCMLLSGLIESAGAQAFVTVEAHSRDSMGYFTIPAANVCAAPAISGKLREMGLEGASVIAPDQGALERARSLAKMLGGESFSVKKHRDRVTGKVVVTESDFDVSGKKAVIYDDIISTGGTIVETAKVVKKQNPARIVVACVHALLVGDALERIFAAGAERVFSTDTLPSKTDTVSVAPLIAEELSRSA